MKKRALFAAGGVLFLLVAMQIVGPWLAGKKVKSMLDGRGHVVSADVSAFPAIKLLWHKADSVTVHMSTLKLGTGDIGAELDETRDAGKVNVVIDDGTLGPLHVRNIEFHKSGDRLSSSASVTEADLSSVLAGVNVVPVAAGDGALILRGSALGMSADARLAASDGKLRISPAGLFGGFLAVTVFEDPRVVVTGVDGKVDPGGFTLTADGHLP
ncbi:MAG: hypothetical protein QOF76_4745 [Solirubrobacteraceae bacterium]|nr:hypothetical protein [Solirubrobacteraceae bacterium]